ncbi:basic helix-loop-helix (bHLH) DNA-binding superfamily protein [Arabidopsis thaliana]|uniref:Basic helix-loop-helix (BHLH) DNA-binding superfamily protein n=2 Tax=Arabidopsis thaliana TaxID=3702 RepID=A0A1P8B0Q3_ARATH|nr:basic helix-loop-helix (bHLH) DNA-binding superfamily protein [Arabidopsis thaliana]ANM62478.1 basic helix-loop-helix (bHLH) DNA-binding superfamily protein [Arabidopsis thaliana]|eukprot:NP_001324634.1 basic helix-loop-helix (bHLH) DNA-binding superfamily protein [Arabidopsis thaliana]
MATAMNVFSTKWSSELDIEEYSIIHQFHMNSLVGDVPQSLSSLDDTTTCYNLDASCNKSLVEERPSKILKTTHISPNLHPFSSSNPPPPKHQPSSRILSFEKTGLHVMNHNSPNLIFSPKDEEIGLPEHKKAELIIRGTKRAQSLTRSQSNAQDHILAERKRREKLTQRFVALSALIPGLKKMDKASVLGDAIKHIKYLQESVKEYEEQKKEKTMESVVLVKKSSLVLDENHQPSSSSSSDGNRNSSSSNLPEIEVRVSGKDVLIKILCEKQKGNVIKIMGEIEKLGLSITNSNVLPFGPTFDISIIAQNNNFDMKIEDVVKNLSFGLSKLT